jgi:hypothetical protein
LAGVARGARASSLRECLAKSAITPALRRRAGGRAGGLLRRPHGVLRLPRGTIRAQYEAALKRCGGSVARGLESEPLSATSKQVLDVFAACMRRHGVNLPNPDTSGRRPTFNTSHLNVAGSKFKAAEAKCVAVLRAAFGPRGGAGGG